MTCAALLQKKKSDHANMTFTMVCDASLDLCWLLVHRETLQIARLQSPMTCLEPNDHVQDHGVRPSHPYNLKLFVTSVRLPKVREALDFASRLHVVFGQHIAG